MLEHIDKFKEMLESELNTEMKNIQNAGTINPDNIDTLKNAFKLMKLIDERSEESEGYSSRRGRSRTTGRFVSRDGGSFGSYDGASYYGGSSNRGSYRGSYQGGYSGHNPHMIQQLEEMLNNAKTDQERQMIEEWMRHAENL